ncbi:glycosyltransferase family 4 protein [Flavobacterium psychrophilum]|uniref:glycosyltransferase family 4 protein n=1 Tax=Flavobacterium psychrophilum TaxID=96345 RepID=UPI00073E2741|nr:glycosyltransferase family 4 protein [Flavobacterium psychrophilum]MEB3398549.1 glycosyltransferase family 4 protein [Flavobacterium psychrophilum]SNB21361.1 putative L-fucosamine transferase [Flavobacterium psychrophilum]SNB97009.1 putative L-fucosamine transferase [Flavobacterium psychrophilum]GAQ47819.1 glycosyltransferase WbuB [Flavobacterium psychrophilum]GAW88111.1 glycosyltransferase WbuB [Flavobacterium psychrophilum]
MRVLFLTLIGIHSINERGIYQDLLRKFVDQGHDVTIVTPSERRKKIATNLVVNDKVTILQVKTFNIQKTNKIEKGIGTLAIEYQYLHAIKKHLSGYKFDLVLYSTPPITFYKVINFIKKRDNAYAYLLLKDIFPQNAVDMKMIKQGGFLHKMFVKKEKKLYKISDTIGCMSQANVDFVLKHNPEIPRDKIEVNPNSIEPKFIDYSAIEKKQIKVKYNLPLDRKILVYGGNLGKPQGLEFLLETIAKAAVSDVFFLIVGDGTEYAKINQWFSNNKPQNANLIKFLPKNDYDLLLAACDIGMIFLDKNFTIPNFPSRLLSYLEMKIPVIAATDINTDIGKIITDANCGASVTAGEIGEMRQAILKCLSNIESMSENSRRLLLDKYTVGVSYQLIFNRIKNNV